MAKSMEEIAILLKNTKFKHSIIGGIQSADMWKKLERLQKEYEEVLKTEQIKYEAVLEDKDKEIQKLQNRIENLIINGTKDIQNKENGQNVEEK